MDDGFLREETILERYALVGGPDEMIPRLRRVAKVVRENPAVADEARREVYALFEKVPPENIERWTSVPEDVLGDDTGAFNMMVALASVPQVAATHRRFGLPPEHLAKTSGITHTRTFWFRKHADGILFRFGCMEFLKGPAPDFVPADFRASLAPDDEVPTFHFPGGPGGLDPEAIKQSFREAVAFWKRAFGHYPKAFACDSWLFNEHWPELIPGTRIARSIDLYERLPSLKYNPDEPSGLFFVYGKERCDPRDFPVTNSLERAFVTLYERGILPCDGCAWVKVDDDGTIHFRS